MEKTKRGRRKSTAPIRDKNINLRVTAEELDRIQKICIEHDLRYVDILMKGAEYWLDRK